MKPVQQTDFTTTTGDCFAACVASILELGIDEVPNFCGLYSAETWEDHFDEWLEERGLYAVSVNIGEEFPSWDFFWIVGGYMAGSRIKHSVVWRNDEMAHDPLPNGAGLDEKLQGYVLVPCDLGQWWPPLPCSE